jgi:hypothetical protein
MSIGMLQIVYLAPYRFQEESIIATGLSFQINVMLESRICNKSFNLPDRISSLTFPLARI